MQLDQDKQPPGKTNGSLSPRNKYLSFSNEIEIPDVGQFDRSRQSKFHSDLKP